MANAFKKLGLTFIMVMLGCVSLSGFASDKKPIPQLTPSQIREKIVDTLAKKSISVQTIGDTVTIRSDRSIFFDGYSSYLDKFSRKALHQIKKIINADKPETIEVTVFGPSYHHSTAKQRHAVKNQSDSLVRYLWRKNIDARFIYSVGDPRFQAGHYDLTYKPARYDNWLVIQYHLHPAYWTEA